MAGFIVLGAIIAVCFVINSGRAKDEQEDHGRRSLMHGAATPVGLAPLIRKATFIKPPVKSTWEPQTRAGYPRAIAVDEHPVVPTMSVGSRRRRRAVRKGKAVGG